MRVAPISVALLVTALTACGHEAAPFDDVNVEAADTKGDSASRPTAKGALPFDAMASDSLSPLGNGYHLYRARMKAGWGIRVKMASRSYKTFVRLTSPSGQRWTAAADVKTPDDDTYWAILDVTELPEDGQYTVLVTSVANMGFFPFPRSWGDYEVGAETDVECAPGGPVTQCPETLTCIHADGDRTGHGTCLRR